ncbi:MAG: CDGSH iron-sulfur domain-containing protein [Betaproteobacteria bacterium]|nr:MAG: CDGSH iron-sulfur domain-containing protein [Betaproteobacteria bacterium]
MAVEIRFTKEGPIEIKGQVTLHAHDGRVVQAKPGDAVYLCRCGASMAKPFCDGAHAAIAFDGSLA